MERCPVCGVPATYAWGYAEESGESPTAKLIGWHEDPSGRGCWISGCSVDYARAVGRIVAEGGERLRLAAHP